MKKEGLKAVDNDIVKETPSIGKTAVRAVKKGTLAAKQAALNVTVTPVNLMRHAVYGVCYGVSYGAVYSALIIGKAFPTDGAISKGLHEGLESAIKDFDASHHEIVINPDNAPVNA